MTPNHPQSNGKVEQANSVLKNILIRFTLDKQDSRLTEILPQAVATYNRRIAPSGYSPFFLLFGTQPPDTKIVYPVYSQEATNAEEFQWVHKLARMHPAPIARSYVGSVKAVRAKTCEFLQESKALIRTFAIGDWVLRVRQIRHKFEPYYDGPWAISACHTNNTYSLISSAYIRNGHPVQSL